VIPRRRILLSLISGLVLALSAGAKDPPAQIILWPPSGNPVLRITLGKFKEVGSSSGQHNYTTETTAENLWGKPIARAEFSLYLFDKNKVRIGEGWISLNNVGPRKTVKFQTGLMTSGRPESLTLVPRALPPELQSYLPPKTISMTVNSVPQGALVKVDGVAVGTTPKAVEITPGKHLLEFSKEGFNNGHFPLEVRPDDVSGGSVSYELGTSAHDTIEMRDGTVLSGDVESVTATDVVVRLGGGLQHFSRNLVKRISLVERDSK
jgi:PEGA domain